MECVDAATLNIFAQPARIVISGCSNSGKSELTKKLIRKYYATFIKIIICSPNRLNIDDPNHKIIYFPDIIDPASEISSYEPGHTLYLLDDLFAEAMNNKYVLDAFTKGRHLNLSCILITQNLFFSGKYARSISLNTSHYILLKNRDMGQVTLLGRQIYGPGRAKAFTEIYIKALARQPFSHLLVDLSAVGSELVQFRSNITGEEGFEIAYQWT